MLFKVLSRNDPESLPLIPMQKSIVLLTNALQRHLYQDGDLTVEIKGGHAATWYHEAIVEKNLGVAARAKFHPDLGLYIQSAICRKSSYSERLITKTPGSYREGLEVRWSVV